MHTHSFLSRMGFAISAPFRSINPHPRNLPHMFHRIFLLVSPVNPLFIILSKAVPYFVLSLLNLTTILLLSVFVLDVPIAGSLPALLVSAMVLMIPTIILSGIIFPIESMPGILQVLSCLIPARWYVETVRRLMIEGVPLVYVWKEVAVMCLMAVVLITATARKFKNRLE